jgi:CDP-diacylglycerol--glycerol-3-phosphate 3-phosphatidyltransferase
MADVLDQGAEVLAAMSWAAGIASFARPAKRYNAGRWRTMLSLPNLLTLSRIIAVPLLVFLLWRPTPIDYAITFVLYCVVGATDYLDGYLARAWGSISRLGQFLDPIADKIMVGAVLIMLISSRKENPVPEIAGLHIIPALVILQREIIVSGLREFLAGLQVSVPVSALAKWKTTLQLLALGALILGGALPDQPWVHVVGIVALWAAAGLTLITGYDYLRIGLRHMD